MGAGDKRDRMDQRGGGGGMKKLLGVCLFVLSASSASAQAPFKVNGLTSTALITAPFADIVNGYKQNGAQILYQGTAASNPSLVVGLLAGAALNMTTSQFNTAVGYTALQSAGVSAFEDTAIGDSSCQKMTTGSYNTCIGQHAAGRETTASVSVWVGNDSGRNSVGAGGSVFVGRDAGRNGGAVSASTLNVGLGGEAMYGNAGSFTIGGTATAGDVVSLTFTSAQLAGSPVTIAYTVVGGDTTLTIATGLRNAIAANANLSNTAAANVLTYTNGLLPTKANVVGLDFAGSSITGLQIVVTSNVTGAATETVAIGAGYIGKQNVAVGAFSMIGPALGAATDNVAVGFSTLQQITSGNSNVAIGSNAGAANTSGTLNVFMGYLAGYSATTAQENTLIGNIAGFALTTGGYNVFIGSGAGSTTTVSTYDVGIGAGALKLLTSGTGSTAVGFNALSTVSTNGSNTAVGNNAGSLLTGGQNTAIGSFAFGLGAAGNNNTALGYNAGLNVSGGVNTIIGASVGSTTLTTGSGNILIGVASTADTPTAATSNYFAIQGNGATPIITSSNIGVAPVTTLYGTVTLNTLTAGTSASFACFTAAGLLISKATAC